MIITVSLTPSLYCRLQKFVWVMGIKRNSKHLKHFNPNNSANTENSDDCSNTGKRFTVAVCTSESVNRTKGCHIKGYDLRGRGQKGNHVKTNAFYSNVIYTDAFIMTNTNACDQQPIPYSARCSSIYTQYVLSMLCVIWLKVEEKCKLVCFLTKPFIKLHATFFSQNKMM